MKRTKKSGFTLIELLTVIAIIAILAGILIPSVGAVRKQANIAASKSQMSNYVTAVTMFKGEYGYFPFADAHADGGALVNGLSDDFIETLSGRDFDSGNAVATGGNRRSIGFHRFSESEFLEGDSSRGIIADRFDNTNIYIVIDGDGDNEVIVPDPRGGGTKNLRNQATAYVLEDAESNPEYFLYN